MNGNCDASPPRQILSGILLENLERSQRAPRSAVCITARPGEEIKKVDFEASRGLSSEKDRHPFPGVELENFELGQRAFIKRFPVKVAVGHCSGEGDGFEQLSTLGGGGHRVLRCAGVLVVSTSVELTPGRGLSGATPLLEEEWDALDLALGPDGANPRSPDWPGAVTTLAADDDPVDSLQIDLAQIFQQRLDGKEGHAGICLTQLIYPG